MTSSKSPHRTVKGSSACGVTVVVLGPDVDAALACVRALIAKGQLGTVIFADNENDGITLAQMIGAENVIIYADSPGLMSANPAHVSDAVPVRCASHEELMELAGRQGSPIGDAAARQAAEHGISYEIRSAADDAGTVIRANGYEDRAKPVTAITVESGYGLISMGVKPVDLIPWKDLQMRVLERIASAGISLEMMQSFAFGTRFLAPVNRLAFMQRLAKEYGLAFHGITGCAKVCVVGTGIRSTPGVFYRSLRALAEHNVPVLHWGDSNVTLSFVVNDSFVRQAENVLHAALAPGSAITSGAAMSFDAGLRLLRLNGRETRLGTRQAQLIRYLFDNAGRVIEVEELARHLFQAEGKDELAAVRVHLHNLRKKIENDPDTPRHIVTVPDQGYLFVR